MKVVITGGLGHLGSSIIRKLALSQVITELTIVDNFATQRYCSVFNFKPVFSLTLIQADVQKTDLIEVFSDAECVIHLAALTEPEESYKRPRWFISQNYETTRRVAQIAAKLRIPLIFPSSTSVYRSTKEADWEIHQLKGSSPYSAAKLREERLIHDTFEAANLEFSIFRLATLCGPSPGMRFHTAINRFCWQIANGQPISIYESATESISPYLSIHQASQIICDTIHSRKFTGKSTDLVTDSHSMQQIVAYLSRAAEQFGLNVEIDIVKDDNLPRQDLKLAPTSTDRQDSSVRYETQEAIFETLELLSWRIH